MVCRAYLNFVSSTPPTFQVCSLFFICKTSRWIICWEPISISAHYILFYKRPNMVLRPQGLADRKTGESEENRTSSSGSTDEEFNVFSSWLV